MKYQKAITLTADLELAILDGKVKLQTGQWLNLNNGTTMSRFVKVSGCSSIWAVHPWAGKITAERWKETVRIWKG